MKYSFLDDKSRHECSSMRWALVAFSELLHYKSIFPPVTEGRPLALAKFSARWLITVLSLSSAGLQAGRRGA
jgi:hypothetical protein